MAFLSVILPCPSVYLSTRLHGVGRAGSDAEFRANLRTIAAIILAKWTDTDPDLTGKVGELFDVVTSEPFYMNGFAKTVERETDKEVQGGDFIDALFPEESEGYGSDNALLWFCSYVGFEKVTSAWAKEHHPKCRGYICMRVYNQDRFHKQIDSHTIQIYF